MLALSGVSVADIHPTAYISHRIPISLGVHLNGRVSHGHISHVHLICKSSLRAGPTWRGSLCLHQRCFEASDCGRLGRQAAGHPWSALRVVKSCRKDCPTASVLLEAKAAALHPERYQSLLSKLSTRGGRGGEKKRRQSDWLSGDRQTG